MADKRPTTPPPDRAASQPDPLLQLLLCLIFTEIVVEDVMMGRA